MQNENILQYIKQLVVRSGMVGKLIAVNTAVFLFFTLLQLIDTVAFDSGFANTLKSYFVAPGVLSELMYKPWSIITHLFTHADFGHFAFNMISLYFAGRIFTLFFSERRLLATYILGGIFAYIVHLVGHNLLPAFSGQVSPGVLGASASVFAIFVAAAAYRPSYIIHLFGIVRVPLFVIAALYILANLVGVGDGSNVAHLAHLGGALFGALSIINANSSTNIMNRFDRFIFKLKLSKNPFKREKSKPKMKAYRQADARNMTDDQYNSQKQHNQERIDAILDKISKRGYDGLTKEEKQILFNESKRK